MFLVVVFVVGLTQRRRLPSFLPLFDKNISSLSAAFASQTMMAAGVTDFVSAKRRESYLAHAACPIAETVKLDLLVAPGLNLSCSTSPYSRRSFLT